jgi:hypothetical protein
MVRCHSDATRVERHETVFPQQVNQAYELGTQMVTQPW